jgi:hypothetical protein
MDPKYGDSVILVKKAADGTVSRLNAIVLASAFHSPSGADRKVIKVNGEALPARLHLDLAFADPGLVPPGQTLKTRDVALIFRHAYDVPEWEASRWIGFEPVGTNAAADLDVFKAEIAELKATVAKQEAILNQAPEPAPAQPSAADLDAVAEEQKAAEATE